MSPANPGTARRASSPAGRESISGRRSWLVSARRMLAATWKSAAFSCSPPIVPAAISSSTRCSSAGSFASAARAFSSVASLSRAASATSGPPVSRRAVRHAQPRFPQVAEPRLRNPGDRPDHDLARGLLQLFVPPPLDLQHRGCAPLRRPGRAAARASAGRAPGRSPATSAPGGRRPPSPGRCCRGTEHADGQPRDRRAAGRCA